MIRANTRE